MASAHGSTTSLPPSLHGAIEKLRNDHIPQHQGKRHAIDTGEIGHLDQWAIQILGIPQARPWKSAQSLSAYPLEGDPQRRGYQHRPPWPSTQTPGPARREHTDIQPDIDHQEQQDAIAQQRGHPAVVDHRVRNPAKNSEIAQAAANPPPQQRCLPPHTTRRRQQRHKHDPRQPCHIIPWETSARAAVQPAGKGNRLQASWLVCRTERNTELPVQAGATSCGRVAIVW